MILNFRFIRLKTKQDSIGGGLVSMLVGCGSCGFVCMLTDIPAIQLYSFCVLICAGLALHVLNAVAVELYPTALR